MRHPLRYLVLIAGLIAIGLIGMWTRRRNSEITCGENLVTIGLAIQNYHDTYGAFPSPDGGGHSWRIRIVPFMFASAMYEEYRFDEAWNSEHNITLDSRPLPVKDGGPDRLHGMPYPYECSPGDGSRSMTSFLMFVGDDAFGKPGAHRERIEITDSLECTLVAAETVSPAVHWLEPADFQIQSLSFTLNSPQTPAISSSHPSGPAVLFADGRVFRISPDIQLKVLRAMVTINGGEDVDRNQLLDQGLLRAF